jgi:ribonuclease HII
VSPAAARKKDPAPGLWRHDRRLASGLGPDTAFLCGVDEVGRGPLAGSVVAACVVFDVREKPIAGVHDSKKLTAEMREALAPRIRERAIAFAVAEASVDEIDTINIYHASFLAMRRAFDAVAAQAGQGGASPALLLVDGNRTLRDLELPQRAIVGGDALSACIASASILAKVARDAAMAEAHDLYPHYGFARHKGYATREHREALREHGPCPLHRRSFSLSPDSETLELPLGLSETGEAEEALGAMEYFS